MNTFFLNNHFWRLYPDLKWQIPLFYFSGLFLLYNYDMAFQFSFIFIVFLSFYIYPYRIPSPTPYPSHTVQICNTDGSCHNVNSDSYNNIYNIFSPVYGLIERIDPCPNKIVIYMSSSFLDAYALYTPHEGRISCRNNIITIDNERGPIQIKCSDWKVVDTLMDEGDLIKRGKYIGMVNKIELTIPRHNTILMVTEGQRVEGFNSVVARWVE